MEIIEDPCSTREAAKLLGVSPRTVQLWAESGVLRAWKTVGGHRRVLRSSIDDILRHRREEVGEATRKSQFTPLVVETGAELRKLYRINSDARKLPT